MITFRYPYHVDKPICRIDEDKAIEHISKGQLVILLNKKGRKLFENMPYHLRPYPPCIHGANICERPRFANEATYQKWDIEKYQEAR